MLHNIKYKLFIKHYYMRRQIIVSSSLFLSKWARINQTMLRNVKLIKLTRSDRLQRYFKIWMRSL